MATVWLETGGDNTGISINGGYPLVGAWFEEFGGDDLFTS